jgi:hypothetical protein
MAVLLAHLLKWQFQAGRRGASWQLTIKEQRKEIFYDLKETPSLKRLLSDTEWLEMVWGKARGIAASETGLDTFPESCTWTPEQILDQTFFPES